MNRHTLAIALVAVIGVGGCASHDCDPTRGGLISAVGCDFSGGYDKRISDREAEEAALVQRRGEMSRERTRLIADQRTLEADLKTKTAERKRAEVELAEARRKLAGSERDNAALQQQAQQLEDEIARTDREIRELTSAERTARTRLSELQKEQKALDAEYRAVTGSR